ncbi:MAG: TonB-dependent receptor [Proteobacteria bacterium]|nr:TonB-dependent receptor [Pseudomonadota bacterium]MDA1351658.1 TonB-dependent receptor [Pseudomonadota bacterium]
MREKTILSPALALGVIAYVVSGQVLAQQASVLEEVIVTARKTEESVMEVPESITSFSSRSIEKSNIKSLKDIGLLVPNMYMSTRLDGFPNVSIRGLGGFGNTQGVGFYLDGIQLFSDASSRFGDMARIEVLKGPQGVLYGGSNIGGAIKFISKRPDAEAFSGNVKLSVGEDGFTDIEAQLNVPIGDTWATRIYAFSESNDGYLTNPNSLRANGLRNSNDPDVGKSDRFGVRATLEGDLSERLSTFITLRYNDSDGPNNTWIREGSGNFQYGNIVDTSFNPRHNRETFSGSIQLDYEFESMLATLVASHTDTESIRESDLDISQEFVLGLLRPEDLSANTVELRLSSLDDEKLSWQVGAYALDLERDLNSVLNITDGFCFLDPGVCDPVPSINDDEIIATVPFEVSLRNREQLAAFANITYRSGPWEYALGLRADRWESKRSNGDTGVRGSNKDTEVLGRASLSWFSTDQKTMLYVTASQGFEPGDLNLANFAGAQELFAYAAENANQYEVGYKGQFLDGRLGLTAAAFMVDYDDRQFELQEADPSGGFVEGIVNVGDSKQSGFEFDVKLNIGSYLTASIGAGYVVAKWDDGVVSPSNGLSIAGQRPPNIAELSTTLALDYEREIASGVTFSTQTQIRYKSNASSNAQFFDAPGDDFPFWKNPGFTVVDLGAALEWDSFELRLHIENVFDEVYYIDVQEFPNFAGSALSGTPGSIIIGSLEQPRRAVASLRYTF